MTVSKHNFVIGIGSQRAGSTLLHKILDQCTEVFMHPLKELHYFDSIYNVRDQQILTEFSRKQIEREVSSLCMGKNKLLLESKQYQCYLRTNNILANRNIKNVDYLDLYRPCLLGNKFIGETTPEYMILPEEGVEAMAKLLGKETFIILLPRNPVDRFISAFKLLKAYGRDDVDFSKFDQEIVDVFNTMPSWIEQQRLFNNYDRAELVYKKYFKNFLKIQYEDIISSPTSVHKILQDFLNINIDKEKFVTMLSTKVNEIGRTSFVSQETRNFLKERL